MPDWDQVYTERSVEESKPVDVLADNKYLLTGAGRALDYASGLGGNSIMLATMGFDVVAYDLSSVAVDKLNNYAEHENKSIHAEVRDLELSPLQCQQQFDVVVVSYFLHRQTLPFLYDCLKKEGLLFYQTFSGKQYDSQGPSNPDFRLKRNELLEVFGNMELIFYREDPEITGQVGELPGQVQFIAKK